ncbi:MAG: DNA recombination protein RmuC [Alphaproteobacteria bacterium]|jgi:DNA recombination protein RmuC|nr:DNA recombination protein RmuC [Alphaproteobacteria bacterium]MCV6599078.1 DNA recombination protein RmuC [Alphaproteobacteria bacterium]
MHIFLSIILGAILGAFIIYVTKQSQLSKLKENNIKLKLEKKQAEENLKSLKENKEEMSNSFKAMSQDVLHSNNKAFLDLAKETLSSFNKDASVDLEKRQKSIENLLNPVHESLVKFDKQIRDIEKERHGAYEALSQNIKHLHQETNFLLNALKAPKAKGQWGEMQLKRVVELAGMVDYVDFKEQTFINSEEGRQFPDVIVNLPGDKVIVIDAKTPLESYMDAMNCDEENKKEALLHNHAKVVREHMKDLGKKSYWSKLDNTPEFVVMFLPDENFFSMALQQDPSLIETGTSMNVVLATPTTLIALLKAVAYGWRQEALANNAREISKLGEDLFERLSVYSNHMTKIGKGLNSAVDNYNKAVGSLERKVFPAARRFKGLGIGNIDKNINIIESIDTQAKSLTINEGKE